MTALMDAEVVSITGTLTVAGGGAEASVDFVPNSQARFTLPVPIGEASAWRDRRGRGWKPRSGSPCHRWCGSPITPSGRSASPKR